MMCPVCKRDLAPTLSICLTCGAMINDTVREELETKISKPLGKPPSISGELQAPEIAAPEPEVKVTPPAPKPVIAAPPKPIAARFETNGLSTKKTSPTLVEFQTPKATVPEWRLQLQNSVRQKVGGNRRSDPSADSRPAAQPKRTTSGANALKVEFVEEENSERHQNPRVASALKRIEDSRRTFSNKPVIEQPVNIGKPAARNYPFNVVARSNETSSRKTTPTVNPSPKPILVSPLKIEKRGYDTNKLPPLDRPVKQSTSIHISDPAPVAEARERWEQLNVEESAVVAEVVELDAVETDEIEDLAPMSMRFNAGLFDLIIAFFGSLILLSPFILSGGSWMTISGALALTASVAIVMFLYLTVSIAFIGRTLGMRLFSLELVDVEENAYPTLHQAAVNSSVYLLSLALLGLGFLPIFFNEERRAAHDILSGTILIREL